MVNGVFSTLGFSDSQKQLASRIGNREDGALAVRLRYKMVESRTTDSKGDMRLNIIVPETLNDETQIHDWTRNFFAQAFPNAGKEEITVAAVPTQQGQRIEVSLKGSAASRYRGIMQNLDLAEEALEKDRPLAARG